MPLFYVQDSDRPAYVVAKTYSEAISKWQHAVTVENDGEHAGNPDGVLLICGDDELIVAQDWLA